jgi:hypothetical protein
MKALLITGLWLSLLLGCAAAPSLHTSRIRLADREIPAAGGTFVFTDVILDEMSSGSWIITGSIRNNTGRKWQPVIFEFQLYDLSKNPMGSQIDGPIKFRMDSFVNGDVKPFGTNQFKSLLRTDTFQPVWKYEVTHDGNYSGKQIVVMQKPWESRELLYEDQAIWIRFSFSEKQIVIILQNKLQSPIKVDWNNISYVDFTGVAHGIMHTGVRYMERDRPQVPTIIPPAAMIEDVIIPSDHITYTSGRSGGWTLRPLFPGLKDTDLYVGKSFSVFMPLELDGAVKNYLFSFRIEREVMQGF